jgi:hypothetical protein
MIAAYVGRDAVHFDCFSAADRASEAFDLQYATAIMVLGGCLDTDVITVAEQNRLRWSKRKPPQATRPSAAGARAQVTTSPRAAWGCRLAVQRSVEGARRRLAARGIVIVSEAA